MIRAIALRFGVAVLLSAFAVPAAMATDATIVADASVSAAHPNLNFGALSNLYVGSGNTTLIQFDLSSLPAGTTAAQIGHAVLRLYVNRVNAPGAVSIQPITSAWGELAVTNATTPTLGPASSTVSVTAANQYAVIDVTALVQGWLTSGSNFGVALSSATANVLFDSKENDETSHVAQLDITVTSQGPVGPAGPAGANGTNGSNGAQGIPGVPGPVGATGAAGAAGPAGATGTFSFASNYATATTYTQGQVVFCATACSTNGSSYISLVDGNTGFDPPANTAQWALIAQVGGTGPTGATGSIGPIGPQGLIGPTGSQGLPGTPGTIGPQGSIGPQGLMGATGLQGIPGTPGATGSQGPAGTPGTTGVAGLQGPIGLTGAQGTPGVPGATGATGTFSFASNFALATTYAQGQVVFCATACTTNGSSYISLVDSNQGFDPPTSNVKWGLIAQVGAPGATGTTGSMGPTGAQGTQGIQGPAGPVSGGSHIFMANVLLGDANSTTQFFSLNGGADPSDVGTFINYNQFATTFPGACTFDSMFLTAGQSGFGNFGSAITITLFRNGVATALAKSVLPPSTNTLTSAQITGQSVAVAAGDTVALQATSPSFTTNGSFVPIANVSVSLHCQ
jgi:hypothetical protein